MGCFNIAATASSLSLGGGDKVLLFPLIPNNFNKKIQKYSVIPKTSNLISNEGSTIFYKPFCLPIKGTYNSYGSIENIVEDSNTEWIEKYFDLDISSFIEVLTDDNSYTVNDEFKNNILQSLSGMWELQLFYDNLINKYNQSNSAFNEASLSFDNLIILGFEFQPTINTGDKRYLKYLNHPDIPDLIIHSDETWTHFFYKSQPLPSMYRIVELYNELKNNKINVNALKNINRFKKSSINLFNIDICINKINQANKEAIDMEEQFQKIQKEIFENSEKNNSSEIYKNTFNFLKYNNFSTMPILKYNSEWQYAATENLKNDLAKMLSFLRIMNSVNKIFMPTQNGEQDGDHNLHKMFTQQTLNVLKYKTGFENF
jgi:hypothetical protein